MPENLTSLIRNLSTRKGRGRRRLSVLEGQRLIEEALRAGLDLSGVVVTPGFQQRPASLPLLAEIAARAVPLESVSDPTLRSLAETETPQGIMAVASLPAWTLADMPERMRALLVLDAVQDPGNAGTMIRTAFCLGADGVVLLPGGAGADNPKVLRASMGAVFHFPVVRMSAPELEEWSRRWAMEVWAADAGGKQLARLAIPRRLMLVVGNEGAGVARGMLGLASERVSIPLARGAESLNVGVAAGIILYEVLRER